MYSERGPGREGTGRPSGYWRKNCTKRVCPWHVAKFTVKSFGRYKLWTDNKYFSVVFELGLHDSYRYSMCECAHQTYWLCLPKTKQKPWSWFCRFGTIRRHSSGATPELANLHPGNCIRFASPRLDFLHPFGRERRAPCQDCFRISKLFQYPGISCHVGRTLASRNITSLVSLLIW